MPPSPVSPVPQDGQTAFSRSISFKSSSSDQESPVSNVFPSPISPASLRVNFPSVPPPSNPSSPMTSVNRPRAFELGYFPNCQYPQEVYPDVIKVKHRRRTTPEQLKVLEHWYDVNPKPDNNLREWLAMELGMTKRNVQVWFQNRSVHFLILVLS